MWVYHQRRLSQLPWLEQFDCDSKGFLQVIKYNQFLQLTKKELAGWSSASCHAPPCDARSNEGNIRVATDGPGRGWYRRRGRFPYAPQRRGAGRRQGSPGGPG